MPLPDQQSDVDISIRFQQFKVSNI